MYVAIMTWNSGGIVLFNVNLFLDNYQFVQNNMKQSGNSLLFDNFAGLKNKKGGKRQSIRVKTSK